jgi:hypothetical protein
VRGTNISYASASELEKLNEDFSVDGTLGNVTGNYMIGAISVKATLKPGQTISLGRQTSL